MAWKDQLLDGSWRGIPFEFMSVDDEIAKSLAIFEYPWTDGADVQDMGNKALQLNIRAIFWGDDCIAQVQEFQDALEERGPGELIHPVFGSMQCVVQGARVHHESDLVDGAHIDIRLIEHGLIEKPFSDEDPDQADVITLAAEAAQLGGIAGLQLQVQNMLGNLPNVAGLAGGLGGLGGLSLSALNLPSLTGFKDVLNGGLAQLQGALNISPLKAIVSGLDPLLHPSGWATDYLAVIDRALEGLSFGGLNALFDTAAAAAVATTSAGTIDAGTSMSTSSGGQTQGSTLNAQNSVAALVGAIQPPQLTDFYAVQVALSPVNQLLPFAPGSLATQGLPVGLGGGSAGAGGSPNVFGGAQGGPGTAGGYGYAGVGGGAGTLRTSTDDTPTVIEGLTVADRAGAQAFVWIACSSAVAQCAAIVLADEPQQRALQPADIERVQSLTRDGLQVAILQARAVYAPEVAAPIIQALKKQALAVQELALAAIRLRPPVVTRTATSGGTWRLLAHQLYGDASRAPELMRLNAAGRQAMLRPRQEVLAYAQ